jgi:hypothetical protein
LTPPGEGIWTEIVVTSSRLTSETNLPLWRYDSPVITSISPTEVPPQAGETVLTIVGYNFGWRPSNATSFVTVASRACATLDWSDTVISCLLPLGTRSAAVMAVAASGLATVREGAGNVTYLRYLPPMVQSVSPRLLPTVGDVVVTVHGLHFGFPLRVSVWLALPIAGPPSESWRSATATTPARLLPCQLTPDCNCTSSELTCVAPAGYGSGWLLYVVNHDSYGAADAEGGVGDLTGSQHAANASLAVHYEPPVITAVVTDPGVERVGECC